MTTPREIIAEAVAGDDWRMGEYRLGMGAPRHADELNNGFRFHADQVIKALTAAGFHIVRKDRFDAMHRRAQVAEGLLSAISHDLEMWNHCLQDKSNWLDTWLFRNALGRLVRLRGRALAKAESASAGFHILSDADLQAVVDASQPFIEFADHIDDEREIPDDCGIYAFKAGDFRKLHAAIRAMQGGKP